MLLSMRSLLILLGLAAVGGGVVCLLGSAPVFMPLGAGLLAFGLALLVISRVVPATRPTLVESNDVRELSLERQHELLRGTSMFLREVQYPYSVRLDTRDVRRHFSAEVSGLHLGFIPTVMTENATDRQGYGYVAYVHDGARWRGPGLPCPDDQAMAVRHAAKCVLPFDVESGGN